MQNTTTSGDTSDDAYIADLLGVADEKIHRLQMDVSKTREDRDATDRRNKSLQKQVCTEQALCTIQALQISTWRKFLLNIYSEFESFR